MIDHVSILEMHLRALKLPKPERELRFHPPRRWRFDLAYPEHKLAMEIEGGIWSGGRHTRGAGFLKDVHKYNQATLDGWRLLRVTPQMINDGSAVELLRLALG